MRTLLAALALLCADGARGAAPRPTFSVDYVVRLSNRDPAHAHVRWELAGIDEIDTFRLVFRDDRTTAITGTGRLDRQGRTVRWTPGSPYAHLAYTVAIDHVRPPGTRLDSHATADWVATRALYLFPQTNVLFRGARARAVPRARLVFHLPHGWHATTALPRLAPGVFEVDEPGRHFARPRGWFVLGHATRLRRRIADSEVTVAVLPGSALDGHRLLRLYAHTMPLLAGLLGPPPPRLLVVSGPDPMWHGGLSAEDSLFVHGHIPLRSADQTSSYLHELFHVWQPFRPGPDGRWISEGLAEYYSLVLQQRAGRLSPDRFARGIALFARYGRFGIDLTRTREPAALNNTAPLFMHRLEQEIRRDSGDARGLDDVVRTLAHDGGPLTTARFLGAATRAAGQDVTPLFRRHVYRGLPPNLLPKDGH